jgi:hypothetical protein
MDADGDLIAHFKAGDVHERGIKHDSLRVTDLGDGLCHDVKLCFTNEFVKGHIMERIERLTRSPFGN